MLLELYGLEETIRSRRETIAHDFTAVQGARAGIVRRLVGNALVHVGAAMRGHDDPKAPSDTIHA